MSQIRVNYPTEVEAQINKIINLKFQAAYTYSSMACFFDRDDSAFPGFSKLFRYLNKRVNRSAKVLMCFQTKRGGRVVFGDVKKPERDEWGTPLEALNICLNICKSRMQALVDLVKLANNSNDSLTVKHINEEHLVHIIECIKHVGENLTCLKKLPTGSEFSYDKIVEREISRRIILEEELFEQESGRNGFEGHRRFDGLVVPRRSSYLFEPSFEKYDI